SPVSLQDAARDEFRIGDEAINARRGPVIPKPQLVQQPAQWSAARTALQALASQVGELLVPGVAHRRADIADMQCVGVDDDSFRDRVTAGNHQVVAGHVELLDRDRHQRQEIREVRGNAGKVLQERGARAAPAQRRPLVLGHVINECEQIRLRETSQDFGQHAFGTGEIHQPVVHDRDASGQFVTHVRNTPTLYSTAFPQLRGAMVLNVALRRISPALGLLLWCMLGTALVHLVLERLAPGFPPANPYNFSPIFWFLLTAYDAHGNLLLLALVGCAFLLQGRPEAASLVRFAADHPWRLAIVVLPLLCLGELTVYRDYPLSMDEYAAAFQARAFAAGHLAGQFPPDLLDQLLPRFPPNAFVIVSHATGEVSSAYWPGYALLVAPFAWLGI